MIGNVYAVYARRIDEKNWSGWCQVSDLETAFKHRDKIRRLGLKAKIYNRLEKKVISKDD